MPSVAVPHFNSGGHSFSLEAFFEAAVAALPVAICP